MQSLAVKYRPTTFEEMKGQETSIKILQQQLATNTFKHSYLFKGTTGSGKTTAAKCFASLINQGMGSPEEIDAASNNSVDTVRALLARAYDRALDCKYKVIIFDECQTFSKASWDALLKSIETPPAYTIYIFCTTDPQKVPATIINRCMNLSFNPVDEHLIVERLEYICECEGIQYDSSALMQIAIQAEGSVRQAITYLEKCNDYSHYINEAAVSKCLGTYTFTTLFDLVDALVEANSNKILNILDDAVAEGKNISLLIDQLLSFSVNVVKYSLFEDFKVVKIPKSYEDRLKYTLNLDVPNVSQFYNRFSNKLLKVKLNIKGEQDPLTIVQVMFSNFKEI